MPTTQRVAYVRVSSAGQNLDRQIEAVGPVDKIYREVQSAASASARPQLREALDYVREGDTLVVASIDRLARSLRDMLGIMEELETKGVTVQFATQGLTIRPDGGDLTTRLVLHIIAAVAQSEREMIRERQAEGIAVAKSRPGTYPGRKPLLDAQQIAEVRKRAAAGVPKTKIARDYGVSRQTLYRHLKDSHEGGSVNVPTGS
ncbi:recombinase family protein [Brachybacterium sp. MASK1Z-5]|uniref:Recombinase family protein n=1 Tax=Brachybacterium halotolerans TaxID=2795215 RepID=A0ABS1BBK5_9MICO|nr:recombinase family protein [Brachybacterium halotolerans]MBK0332056.1 recombinase family protein [Brachybacterium halotolerans]